MRNIDLVYKALLIKPQTTQQIQKTLDGLLTANSVNTALINLQRAGLAQIVGKDIEQSKGSTSKRSIHVYKALPKPMVTARTLERQRKKIDLSKKKPVAILKQLIIETNPLFMMYRK